MDIDHEARDDREIIMDELEEDGEDDGLEQDGDNHDLSLDLSRPSDGMSKIQ